MNVVTAEERNNTTSSVASSVTTPGDLSVFNDERWLVNFPVPSRSKRKWVAYNEQWVFPWAIIAASMLELLFHVCSNKNLQRLLRFEPRNQIQLWRFVTYMLVHDDWCHLGLNVLMQCLFAAFLEKNQGRLAVVVYLLGGVTGVLGASCVHPDLVIGASAGVYALLMSNLADLILNFETIKYKISRMACVGIIVLSDVIYNVIHCYSMDEPLISWGAHIVGGTTGFLVGLILFRRTEEVLSKRRNKILFWIGLLLYASLLISLVVLTFQIKKCTPAHTFKKYVYFC